MFGNKSLDKTDTLVDQATQSAEQVSSLLHSGIDSVRDSTRQLRDKALQASNCTVGYVKEEPVKSVLIAAAAGAALMALVSLLGHARNRH